MEPLSHFKTARSAVREIVQRYCDPAFSNEGFARKSLVWNRWVSENLCHVVDVQLDKHGDEKETAFTLNFGVFKQDVFAICWGRLLSGFIQGSDCIASLRVGQLAYVGNLKAARDTWWVVSEQSPLTSVGEEVVGLIRGRGIPFLDSVRSLSGIERLLTQTYEQVNYPASILYLAVVKAELGDEKGARDLLERFTEPSLRAWKDRAAQVKARLHL